MTYLSIKEIFDTLSEKESSLIESYRVERDSGDRKVIFSNILLTREIRKKFKDKIISKYDN
jgi:hypothetical protein